jgi:hypothetical protein
MPDFVVRHKRNKNHTNARVHSRISVAHNEVQLREGEAPAEPCVSAVQWLGRSLALPK